MSSKKERRRKRQQAAKQEQGRRKVNPATVFIALVALTLGAMVTGALMFGDRSGPGDPPWPGAVWSPSHGHWH